MNYFFGQIIAFAGSYYMDGWLPCDGRALNINGNEPLYTLLGTTYGGDGKTTFNIPDLRGRTPICAGQHANVATNTNFVMGARGGTESVTLTNTNMPAHTHPLYATTNTGVSGTGAIPINQVFAASPVTADLVYGTIPTSWSQAGSWISATANNGAAHNNMMPFIAVNWLICTGGIFPTAE